MAKAATRKAVEKAHSGPDYASALEVIKGRLADAKSAQGQAGKRAAAAWKDIEGMGLHKQGAQDAAKIIGIEDEDERVDRLRTFSKLLEAAGIGIPQDLADVAENKPNQDVVPRKSKAAPDAKLPDPPAGDTDLADEPPLDAQGNGDQPGEAEPPIERKGRNKVVSIGEAKARVREHLGGSADGMVTH